MSVHGGLTLAGQHVEHQRDAVKGEAGEHEDFEGKRVDHPRSIGCRCRRSGGRGLNRFALSAGRECIRAGPVRGGRHTRAIHLTDARTPDRLRPQTGTRTRRVGGACGAGRTLRVLVVATLLVSAVGAAAQQNAVSIRLAPGGFGLDGAVRPGSWAGVRLLLDNAGADDRDVTLSWELADEDGDRVVAERRATLARQRADQAVWLYAALPARLGADDRFTARCVDAETGALLASAVFGPDPDRLASPDDTLMVVTSGADLGLSDYGRHETAHAAVRLVRGVSLSTLPDRWTGLQAVSTLVWTPDGGGDPADPQQVGDATLEAVREWCYRGGHLVIMLPAVNNTWFGSPLADLLPVNANAATRVDTERWGEPEWMGGLRPDAPETVSQTVFRVGDAAGPASPTVLLRDAEKRPVAVARRFGFGRVTLLGLDLTQAPIRRSGMPRGERRLWSRLLNLTAPVFAESYVAPREKDRTFVPAAQLQRRPLGDFVGGRIAMTGTVSAVLFGAVVLFGLYWLLAGVALQPLLKSRGRERWAWPVFAAVVLAFAGVAWGAAALVRPGAASLRHISVLDVDANRGVSRVRSFVSVFLPDFGVTEAALAQPAVAGLPGRAAQPAGVARHARRRGGARVHRAALVRGQRRRPPRGRPAHPGDDQAAGAGLPRADRAAHAGSGAAFRGRGPHAADRGARRLARGRTGAHAPRRADQRDGGAVPRRGLRPARRSRPAARAGVASA